MQFDFFTVGLLVLVAVMIIFMFRSSRRRRREAEELQAKIQPGAEVMTQHGIYGRLVSIDETTNEALVETTPGTVLRVHRQVIARVVDPTENEVEVETDEPVAELNGTPVVSDDVAPEYGERVDDTKPPRGRKKPTE